MTSSQGTLRNRLMLQVDAFRHADRLLVTKALTLAEETHRRQYRKPTTADPEFREPYIVHPMRVALILLDELGYRETTALCAALLHDVVEDSDGKVTTNDIEQQFNRSIALVVSVVTKPPHDKKIPREEQLKTYHERVAQSAVPTRLIKLADRLDNILDALRCNDRKFQERYLEETREIYLPLAQETDQYLYEEIALNCEHLETLLAQS